MSALARQVPRRPLKGLHPRSLQGPASLVPIRVVQPVVLALVSGPGSWGTRWPSLGPKAAVGAAANPTCPGQAPFFWNARR